jgi:hypothetical protein
MHLFGGLDVELLRVELEALGIVHRSGGLYAQKDLMCARILVLDVVRVVGRDQRDVEVFLEPEHRFGYRFVGSETVILNLQEEVSAAKHGLEVACGLLRLVVFAFDDVLRDFAGETSGETDQAFSVFGEEVLADARLLVEAVQSSFAGEANQVAIASFVFGEDEQVVVLRVRIGALAAMIFFLADVELAAKNGAKIFLLHRLKEVHGAEDVAVVGHGGRGLAELLQVRCELVHVAGSVEQRVVGVEMEVRELSGHGASLLPC